MFKHKVWKDDPYCECYCITCKKPLDFEQVQSGKIKVRYI